MQRKERTSDNEKEGGGKEGRVWVGEVESETFA